MELDEKVKKSIEEVLRLRGQNGSYEKAFTALIKNFISDNYTDDDILEIIEATKIKEDRD